MNNPTYYTCFTEIVDKLSRGHSYIFGLIRQMALKENNNKIRISQGNIKKITGLFNNQQSKYTSELEEFGLLKVIRAKKTGRIKYYQVFEINFQVFIHFPDEYENAYKNNKIEHIYTSLKTENFMDSKLAEILIEKAIKDNSIDIEQIKKNIAKLEIKTLKDPEGCNDSKVQSMAYKSIGPVLKTDNYIKQHPSDVEITFSKSEGTRSKLQRRVKKQKRSTRDKLKGVCPVVKEKPISSKRKTINAYYSARSFVQVKRHWNSLPGLKKISDLKDKQNKTLDTSILATKSLLSGSLFKTGVTLENGRKREIILSDGFEMKEEVNLSWLLSKITLFHKIVTDKQLFPFNKQYISKLTLGDFILGTERGQYEFASSLFDLCCGEIKTTWEDNDPQLTKKICSAYNLYTEQDKDFSGKELKTLARLGERIAEFAKTPDATRSHTMGKGNPFAIVGRFFVAQDQEWRGKILEQTPNYFAGDHAWSVFQKRLEY